MTNTILKILFCAVLWVVAFTIFVVLVETIRPMTSAERFRAHEIRMLESSRGAWYKLWQEYEAELFDRFMRDIHGRAYESSRPISVFSYDTIKRRRDEAHAAFLDFDRQLKELRGK
jgi:hypothetical protein